MKQKLIASFTLLSVIILYSSANVILFSYLDYLISLSDSTQYLALSILAIYNLASITLIFYIINKLDKKLKQKN